MSNGGRGGVWRSSGLFLSSTRHTVQSFTPLLTSQGDVLAEKLMTSSPRCNFTLFTVTHTHTHTHTDTHTDTHTRIPFRPVFLCPLPTFGYTHSHTVLHGYTFQTFLPYSLSSPSLCLSRCLSVSLSVSLSLSLSLCLSLSLSLSLFLSVSLSLSVSL